MMKKIISLATTAPIQIPSTPTRCKKTATCLHLSPFFSSEECQFYVQQTEAYYTSVGNEYPVEYRNNERCLVQSEALAEQLFTRIMLACGKEFANCKPFGFDSQGIWRPYGVNNVLKFSRYKPGQAFAPHIDNVVVKEQDKRSIFTVIIYLNEDFVGGNTMFYDKQQFKKELPLEKPQDAIPLEIIKPVTGTCIVFPHDLLHEGEVLVSGTKYIIRTEIMFERITNTGSVLKSIAVDPAFIKSNQYYMVADDLEEKGQLYLATKTYLQGLAIQAQYSPSNDQASAGLHYDVLMKMFSYLPARDLIKSASLVARKWNFACHESSIWENLYKRKYNLPPSHVTSRNWYYLYRDREHTSKGQTLVIDAGTAFTRVGFAKSIDPIYEFTAIAKSRIPTHTYHALEMVVQVPYYDEYSWLTLPISFSPLYVPQEKLLELYKFQCAMSVNCWDKDKSTCKVQMLAKNEVKQVYACEWLGAGMKEGLMIHFGGTVYLAARNGDTIQVQLLSGKIENNSLWTHFQAVHRFGPQIEIREWKRKYCKLRTHPNEKQATYKTHQLSHSNTNFELSEEALINDCELLFESLCAKVAEFVTKYKVKLDTVVLSGGHTLMPNFVARMHQFITSLHSTAVLIAHPHRDKFSWYGKCKYANGEPLLPVDIVQ